MYLDTDVLVIGAGLAGVGFGVQLVRKYGHTNFEIIEKSNDVGGTWLANSYPGCGCDVASHYYSYSFEPNPNWSSKFPLQPEILAYLKNVACKYGIGKNITFNSMVTSACWEEGSATWMVTVKDLQTSHTTQRRCKVLISAVGVLSIPNECKIPNASDFQGRIFHTARWDHTFDCKDKEIVVIGNGCSATQSVPMISGGSHAAKKVTQFARQAQWIFPRPNPTYSNLFKWTMAWIPFAMRLYRLSLNYVAEVDFYSFYNVEGAGIRSIQAKFASDYMRSTAPEKYHEFLVPKSEPGCLRRVMDTDYLSCLNRSNVELIYDDPIESFVEDGVRTASGRIVRADAAILANGFQVQQPLLALNISGQDGVSISDHWNKFSEGAASAYFGTCLSDFPNFFVIMGPNTASGHGNVLYVTECQINWILRVIKPVLKTLWAKESMLSGFGSKADMVKVKPDSERADLDETQRKCNELVWSSGCTSWALDPTSRRNVTMYPDFQYKYWFRSLFVSWKNFDVIKSRTACSSQSKERSS